MQNDAKYIGTHQTKNYEKLQSHLALSKKEGQLSGGTVPQGSTFEEHPILERQQEAEQLCPAKVPFGRWKSLVHDYMSSSSSSWSSSSSPFVSSALHHHRQASHGFCISSHALFLFSEIRTAPSKLFAVLKFTVPLLNPHLCWRSRKDCIHIHKEIQIWDSGHIVYPCNQGHCQNDPGTWQLEAVDFTMTPEPIVANRILYNSWSWKDIWWQCVYMWIYDK